MKKLIFLLCLSLCLSSAAAMSEVSEDAFEPEYAVAEILSDDEADDDQADEEDDSEDEEDYAWDSAVENESDPEMDEEGEDELPFPSDEDETEEVQYPGETDDEDAEAETPSDFDVEEPELPEEELPDQPEEMPELFGDEPDEAAELEDAEAWLYIDGELFGGDIEEVFELLEGDETVYIASSHTLHVSNVSLYTLAGVRFRPDPEVFDDDYTVALYTERPTDDGYSEAADLSGVSEGDYGDIYLRVELLSRLLAAEAEAEPEEEEIEEEAVEIGVRPSSFPTGVWVNKQPTFELSGIPKDRNWNYAVLIYDQRFIPLEGNEYVPADEGKYTLRFVIQDEMGDIRAVSDNIRVWFDWTPPELNVEQVEDENYAIDISATDEHSGVAALSVDAGQHWFNFDDTETYRYVASSKRTLTEGMIRVRDEAGNVFKSKEPYELTKKEEEEEKEEEEKSTDETKKKKKLPHAKDNGEDADPYALRLKLPDEPMRQLIIGGKAKDLTLMVERFGEQAGRTPASFTGVLTRWLSDGTDADAKLDPDTLLLDAALDLDMEEAAINCEWHFNGEVCKELADAGIVYLAFRVGEDMSVVPTQGFTGGSKYTELKMLGVSTRKFDYTLTMKLDTDPGHMTVMTDNDFCQDCDMDLSVVVENMSYLLSTSVKSPMYYYDVYLGPDEMLEYPFGTYEAAGF